MSITVGECCGVHDGVRLREVPGFTGLWLANAGSSAASMVAMFATSVVLTISLQAPAVAAGLVAPLSVAGALLFGLVAGVVSDRVGPVRTMIRSVWLRMAAYALPLIAWALGYLQAWQLLAAVFVVSAADTFFVAAHTAVLPALVGRERVPDAAASLQGTAQVIQLVGPAAGAGLTRLMPAPLVLLVAMGGQVLALLGLRGLPVDPPRAAVREPALKAIRQGIKYLANTPLLLALMGAASLNNMAGGFYAGAETVYVLRDLAVDPLVFGALWSLSAVGGILGALIAPRLGRKLGPLRTLFLGSTLMPINFAMIPLASAFPGAKLVIIGVSYVLFGISLGLFSISNVGMTAKLTPLALLARVSATRRTVTLGASALGGVCGALLSQAFGTLVPLWIAVGIASLQLIPLLRAGIPRRGDASAAEIEAAQDVSANPPGNSGQSGAAGQ